MKLALAPIALAVVLAAGCGGGGSSSSSPSPKDWADNLCSAITTWSTSVQTAGQSLKNGSLSEGDLKKTTSEIKDATSKFSDDLKGLGKPDTDAGQQAKDAVDQLSTQIKDDVDKLQSAVADAGGGAKGAVAAASTIATTLSTMSTQIGSAAAKLQQADAKGELQQGFKDAPACKKLTG
jgi:ABC-type transporter Mla subunit MlaD